MLLHHIGDTIPIPSQAGTLHSYPVYTTRMGHRYYARVGGCWYYAQLASCGFTLGFLVPRALATRLWTATYVKGETCATCSEAYLCG